MCTSKFRLQHTKRLMVSHRFYCDQPLLHLKAILNLWSVALTFKDLITFETNYHVCGFSRVSLRQFFSIEIFKRWKEIALYCPLKNRYTRYTRYSRYTRYTWYSWYARYNRLSLLLGDSRYIEKNCLNTRAKMTNLIHSQK